MKKLYYFFRQHKPLLWTIVVLCTALLAGIGAQCKFEENIFQLLPETGDEAFRVTFTNLKLS